MKLVTVPFSDKIITEHFESEEPKVFAVDYKKSTLKDNEFFTYLANIDISINLSVNETLNFEEKSSLLLSWINSVNLVPIDTLTIAWLDIIMRYKKTGVYFPSFLYNTEKDLFIESNHELLNTITEFLDSLLFHNMTILGLDKKENATNNINDPHIIPINIMNLFAINDFYNYFLIAKPIHKTWYVHQFDERPEIINHYYINPNPLMAICNIEKRSKDEKI